MASEYLKILKMIIIDLLGVYSHKQNMYKGMEMWMEMVIMTNDELQKIMIKSSKVGSQAAIATDASYSK